jgi:hypothetical protein
MEPVYVRRRLLEELYEFYKEYPAALCDSAMLMERVGVDDFHDYEWNIMYLIDASLVQGEVHCARITVKGIDLIENVPEFNKKFPGV